KPLTPSGPSNGKIGEEHIYTTLTVDPDDDQLYYMWDWGDGTLSDWIGPYSSGAECSESHIWNNRGGFNIKVKAKDINDIQSPWSDPLSISIPRNKAYINRSLINFLDSQLYLFPMIRQLLLKL
ncbi:MAG: PKD domain-containing protein, partial [Thermoplasmatales archaeon]